MKTTRCKNLVTGFVLAITVGDDEELPGGWVPATDAEVAALAGEAPEVSVTPSKTIPAEAPLVKK